jgi:hypothetical protein
MEILRPQIVRIGNRCYRKNPVLQREGNTAEEEEFTGIHLYYHMLLLVFNVMHLLATSGFSLFWNITQIKCYCKNGLMLSTLCKFNRYNVTEVIGCNIKIYLWPYVYCKQPFIYSYITCQKSL